MCNSDIGLLSITYNCTDQTDSLTQVFTLKSTGVNTYKLSRIENFVNCFRTEYLNRTVKEIHSELENIEHTKELYNAWQAGLGAGFACTAFAFLLGGGPVEMICTFLGAGCGQFTQKSLHHRKFSMILCTVIGVIIASLTYAGVITLAEKYCICRPPIRLAISAQCFS